MKLKTSCQLRAEAVDSATRAIDCCNTKSRIDTSDDLKRLVRHYQEQKRPITVNFRRILPALNSADRLTHLIHPYPAKLLMHIPFFFLANDLLSKRGDVV